MPPARKKPGAPLKAPGGLNQVLFIRADSKLIARLESLRQKQIASKPGSALSRADVARQILWDAVNRDGKKE